MKEIRAMKGANVRPGMSLYKLDDTGRYRLDVVLSSYLLPTRACRGTHFKTSKGQAVCIDPVANVWASERV